MTIIFADTNRLLLALAKRKENQVWIYSSGIYQRTHTPEYHFYLSIYVAKELDRVYNRKFGDTHLIEVLNFLEILGCKLIDMEGSSQGYIPYINDVKDALFGETQYFVMQIFFEQTIVKISKHKKYITHSISK